ncbi:response regulator [Paraglaciecola aquimarina]|uniref:Response regulator n=1 Tax=Paraglaciecola aquimarina TaxID=1235557 RepID=A0ABU3SV24_9ALTE|nr:response regulator [Paraglaciecola aquimarina]MDU0353875.1 response regulator [Paraglaciecola aquimarina]
MYDCNIVVIDDDEVSLEILQTTLKGISLHEIICFSNSDEAMSFVRSAQVQSVSLVVCDWLMPDVSGLEILEALRETHPKCPFLMVTGNATTQLVVEAMRLGATDFIVKPFHTDNLFAKVERLIRDAD